MVMVPKFSNFLDELSKNNELKQYELSGFDSTWTGKDQWSLCNFSLG